MTQQSIGRESVAVATSSHRRAHTVILLLNLVIGFLAPFPVGLAFLFPATAALLLRDAPRALRLVAAVIAVIGLLWQFTTSVR